MRLLVYFICIYLCFASPALPRCVAVAGEEEEEAEVENACAGEESPEKKKQKQRMPAQGRDVTVIAADLDNCGSHPAPLNPN